MAAWLFNAMRGAAAGIAATIPMSALMVVAQRVGALGTQPPEAIVDAAFDKADVDVDGATLDAAAVVAHVAFGASIGALYGLLRGATAQQGPGKIIGAAYAVGVWAASYQGWIPAFDALPRASHDREDRQVTMVLAHVVYGATLGALTDRTFDAAHT
ncbi:MAG: hypothetical protein GEU74_06275 [Nitriliruptorales bacterium]|nr:hypothetical protein [Nitriliruptorales bacterium]